ncbi:MAG: hypothetical protein CM1200mP16_09410 [Nitrospina sp.]|nr:MAG: hypothetical protein CM1200mP16_09410 [Nitrospina sp.]
MKILITGATGSVGNTLLPLLAEKGHELIVLTRNSKTAQSVFLLIVKKLNGKKF